MTDDDQELNETRSNSYFDNGFDTIDLTLYEAEDDILPTVFITYMYIYSRSKPLQCSDDDVEDCCKIKIYNILTYYKNCIMTTW